MGGRADEATLSLTLSNVTEAAGHSKEFLAHLDSILASSAFRGSRRSQEFLRYVVQRSLHGEFDCLKERSIGIEIFHRDADYDTGDDAIVRVTASDVRKRLIQYYAENDAAGYRIDLPPGSYVPLFRRIAYPPTAPVSAVETAIAEQSAAQPVEPTELSPEHATESAPGEMAPRSASRLPGWALALLIALPLLAACLTWAAIALLSAPASHREYSFYKELLGPIATDPQMETEIVLSNPRLLLYRGSNAPPHPDEDGDTLTVPLPADLAAKLASAANDTQAQFPYHRLVLDAQDYTGLGEAKAAYHVGELLQTLGRTSHISEARFLNWDIARSQHFIILGAPHMSVWTQSSLARAPYTMEHDQIRNNHPLAGEPNVYASGGSGSTLEDYGLIWMSRLPSGSRVLVLAGITSTGTAGVGSFFSDPASMRAVYERLKQQSVKGEFPSDWQALLRINAREDVPVKVSLVTVRTFAP